MRRLPGRLRSSGAVLPVALLILGLTPGVCQDRDGDQLSDDQERIIGTSLARPDTDGDGLLDGWEVHGLAGPGYEEPLPDYGADPLRKDIFVEIDWMAAAGENSQRNAIIAYQAAVDVIRVFQASGTDIRIHFDLGPRIEAFVPQDLIEPELASSSFMSVPDENKVVPYQDFFPARPGCSAGPGELSLYDVYCGGLYFRPSRRNIFYYVVIAEQSTPWIDPGGDSAHDRTSVDDFADEEARREGLQDAGVKVVLIYRKPVPDLSPERLRYKYSVSLLHELGHAFGLGHGGSLGGFQWDNTNYKPNYPSIMNYLYEFCGVGSSGGLPVMGFSHGLLNVPLDERALSEPGGMGPLPSAHVLECAGFAHLPDPEHPRNIDWDQDGQVDLDPVVRDIDGDATIDSVAFTDHDDWGRLAADGFDGIGLRAYGGCGLMCRSAGEVYSVTGDFNGDRLTDLLLVRGDEAAWAICTGDGAFEINAAATCRGSVGNWKIRPGKSVIVADFFGLGRDMVFIHQSTEIAVVDYNQGSPRLRWYEDRLIGAGGEDGDEGWRIGPSDRFLETKLGTGADFQVAVTNGRELAVLARADSETADGMFTGWFTGDALLEWTQGAFPSLRPGRQIGLGQRSFFISAGGALLEVTGPWTEPVVIPVDDSGSIRGAEGAQAAGGPSWAVSPDDCLVPVELDGDGTEELVVKNRDKLGFIGWSGNAARLLWAAGGRLGQMWPLTSSDRMYHGQFKPGGGEELVLSSGHSWVTVEWDAPSSSARIHGINIGYVLGNSIEWELGKEQALFAGPFLPGRPDLILAQGTSSLLLAQFGSEEGDEEMVFHPVLRLEARVGQWVLGSHDLLSPAQLDADPELELIVRRGALFGSLDFSPGPRSPFVMKLDEETLEFVEEPRFLRGDANGDGDVDISDPVAILGSLFLGFRKPPCHDAADADDDGIVNISDPIFILSFLFSEGRDPPLPGPTTPGIDPTPDDLSCGK